MIMCLGLLECLFLLPIWIWVLRHAFMMEWIASYAKMWLQLFFPSYLIIIAISIIISSRYSTRILRLTYTRSLPVLATLFLLSYTGVLRTVSTVLFSYSTITHLPSYQVIIKS